MSWISSEQNNLELSILYVEEQASGTVYCNDVKSDASVVKEANPE